MNLSLTPLEIEAIGLSLRVAFWAILFSLPFGIGVAWLLARRRAGQIKAVVNGPATTEIEISRAADSNVTGELRSRKVRLESALRRLESA